MSAIIETLEGNVLTLSFNRPDRKNALTLEMYELLSTALRQANQNQAVKAVVLTGNGDAFTSGNDLNDFMMNPPKSVDTPVFRFLEALCDFSKPLIAAVNGVAVGIGTTMLLHCDLVYATQASKFSVPFAKLGLVPEAGISYLLPQMVGQRKAAELLLLGDSFTATVAQELGFVNQVVASKEELALLVATKAKAISLLPPQAIRQTKALLKKPFTEQLKKAMLDEGEVFISRLGSPETAEAITAFFTKRAPDFSKFS
jgi:enoyl-CoA hydratase/carnithine racemase